MIEFAGAASNSALTQTVKKQAPGKSGRLMRPLPANRRGEPGHSDAPPRTQRSRRRVKAAALTRREREVVALVAEGLRNKEIAERLSISRATVRHHLSAIFLKLGVPDRLKLIVYAFRHGLAEPAGAGQPSEE